MAIDHVPHAPARRAFGERFRPRDPSLLRSARRAVTLIALLPLSLILAVKAAHLTGDPYLNAYGIAVLLATMTVFFVAFSRYEDPARRPPLDAEWRPVVSLLVAVKDEVDGIERCIRSMVGSDYPRLQVIVVDDGSTDGTVDRLLELVETMPFTLVPLPVNRGKKRALTEGVRRARGKVLAFTDSDCVLAPDALRRCVDALASDPTMGAVSGHARAANASMNILTRMQDVWYDGQFGITKAAEASLGAVTCVSGPLAVFRREAIVNYFPAWAHDRFAGQEFRFATDRQLTGYVLGQRWRGEKLQVKFGQDPLVNAELHPPRQWRVGYSRAARVLTDVPDTMAGFLRQQIRWKKSFVRNLFFTGTFYWRFGLVASALFYGHLLWVLAAPLMAFRHLVWLPAHGYTAVTLLYLTGVALKGGLWGLAYRVQNPGDRRWALRPLMSLLSAMVLSWLLLYAVATLRSSVWARHPATRAAPRTIAVGARA